MSEEQLTDEQWEKPLEDTIPVCLITDPDCTACQ